MELHTYAKVFTQIFDSSIADNWKHRHVFEDLLKLSDSEGFIDMTIEAIVCRTRLPREMVKEGIAALESPDPHSRTKDFEGRRLIPIDPERSWGWKIVNYQKYREIKSDFARREYMRDYMKKKRSVKLKVNKVLTEVNVVNKKANLASASVSTSASVQGNGDARGKGFPITIDSAVSLCSLEAIPKEFVMHCWDKAESRGGRDSVDMPIMNFPAYVRTQWKYERERMAQNGVSKIDGADKVNFGDEYKRILETMKSISSAYGDHQTWNRVDIEKYKKLKTRKIELKTMLGMTI